MTKKLALCIPAFNAEKYLPRLLISAKNQPIPFDEILVYNDCSTDNTAEIAKEYGAKVINGNVNYGCSYGKNKLAEICKCDWIHFHDADDDILPNFTTVAQGWLNQNSPPDIILLNFEYRDFISGDLIITANYNRSLLLKDPCKFVLTNKLVNFGLYNREAFLKIGGFDLDINVLYNEDRAFYSRAIINNLSFDYEPTITCINYRHIHSMSTDSEQKCTLAHYHVSKKIASVFQDKYPIEIANSFWSNAVYSAKAQDWQLTKEHLLEATKLAGRIPLNQGNIIKVLSFLTTPFFAYWIREKLIRLFKPQLRK